MVFRAPKEPFGDSAGEPFGEAPDRLPEAVSRSALRSVSFFS